MAIVAKELNAIAASLNELRKDLIAAHGIAAGFAEALRGIGKNIDRSVPEFVRQMLNASIV